MNAIEIWLNIGIPIITTIISLLIIFDIKRKFWR